MSRTKLRTGILIDRIKEEIGLEKDTELADLLGKAQNTISTWRIRNSRLPIDQLIPKCDDLGIKIDWNYVIYGEHGRVSVGMQPYSLDIRPGGERIPLFLVPAPAGAAPPADDHVEQVLTAEELITDGTTQKVFGCRIVGDSMEGAGIVSGDTVIVRQQETAKVGDVIVVTVDGELTIKRYERIGERAYVYPDDSGYQPLEIREGMSIKILGVVVKLIRNM